jgi:hypothetical protein
VTDQTVFVLKLLVTALVAAALSVVMQARGGSDAANAGEPSVMMESGLKALPRD